MTERHHSIQLDASKCVGCTSCLKRCPMEAIRIRDGRAFVMMERCIDCGECIRVCKHHARVVKVTPFAEMDRYPYRIALFAPSLYGQFSTLDEAAFVPDALRQMGFDEAYSAARGADIITIAIRERLQAPDCPRPLISASCPAVVRLIQRRFPQLLPNVVDVRSAVEVAAMDAKHTFCKAHNVSPKDVGCFFITPCDTRSSAVDDPLGIRESAVDGTIPFLNIFGKLSAALHKCKGEPDFSNHGATGYGVGWARSGGEGYALGVEETIAVDGIDNVIQVLESIENGLMPDLIYLESSACVGGCVGGPLTFANAFIARNRIRQIVRKFPQIRPENVISTETMERLRDKLYLEEPLSSYEESLQLDTDMRRAIARRNENRDDTHVYRRAVHVDCRAQRQNKRAVFRFRS